MRCRPCFRDHSVRDPFTRMFLVLFWTFSRVSGPILDLFTWCSESILDLFTCVFVVHFLPFHTGVSGSILNRCMVQNVDLFTHFFQILDLFNTCFTISCLDLSSYHLCSALCRAFMVLFWTFSRGVLNLFWTFSHVFLWSIFYLFIRVFLVLF